MVVHSRTAPEMGQLGYTAIYHQGTKRCNLGHALALHIRRDMTATFSQKRKKIQQQGLLRAT
jgi:hypothetical protein